MATKAELESANQELRQQVEAAKAETASLGKRVVERARELAAEHEWCEVVEKALEELGLSDRVPVTVKFTMEIALRVSEDWDDKDIAREFFSNADWGNAFDYNIGAGQSRPNLDDLGTQDGMVWDDERSDKYKVEVVR